MNLPLVLCARVPHTACMDAAATFGFVRLLTDCMSQEHLRADELQLEPNLELILTV